MKFKVVQSVPIRLVDQCIQVPPLLPVAPTFPGALSPYGSYSSPPCPQQHPIPHPPVSQVRRRVVKKTILLAKLSERDSNKPSLSRASRLFHTVITTVVVSLDSTLGECTVTAAAQKVPHQVGLEVVLLESKLYPLVSNEATSGLDFWKSTCKIIAVPRSSYEKLVENVPGEELSQIEEDEAISEQPSKKRKGATNCDIATKVDALSDKLDKVMDKGDKIEEAVEDLVEDTVAFAARSNGQWM